MSEIQRLYLLFLSNFPEPVQPVVSILLAIFLVYSLIKIIQKEFVYLVALVVLLPASVSILKNVWEGIVSFIKFLLNVS